MVQILQSYDSHCFIIILPYHTSTKRELLGNFRISVVVIKTGTHNTTPEFKKMNFSISSGCSLTVLNLKHLSDRCNETRSRNSDYCSKYWHSPNFALFHKMFFNMSEHTLAFSITFFLGYDVSWLINIYTTSKRGTKAFIVSTSA